MIACTNGEAARALSDNRERYIAQSILHGLVSQPLLDDAKQARDVILWNNKSLSQSLTPVRD